jgi:hypothetical protein
MLPVVIIMFCCSLNTPPGTKLYLKNESLPMVHGIVLLKSSSVEVLGGRVPPLVEKWELNRVWRKQIFICIVRVCLQIQFHYSVEPVNRYESAEIRDRNVYTIAVNGNHVSNFLAEAGKAYTGPNR